MAGFNRKAVSDLVLLESIDEKHVSDVLKARHAKDEIYTYIGPVLLSVNPFKKLNIYTPQMVDQYRGKYMYELPPHIFAIAENAVRMLKTEHQNQCVIISGESGAGKTEASKLLMQYISAVTGNAKDIMRVKEQLLKSNPVLEAFGNAKTLRNDNSSRFGKYMEVFFNQSYDPTGGLIHNFLLEKSRVVHPGKGERNFHIFYQLARGLSAGERKEFYMDDAECFKYLAASECFDVNTIKDAVEYKETLNGLRALGLSEAEIKEILSIVAAVLWIGEINFTSGQDRAEISNRDAVNIVAHLLGIDASSIKAALTSRTINAGKSASVKSNLDIEKAVQTRDAFAKQLYSRLFEWIVNRINKALVPREQTNSKIKTNIGILDIYGFEIFQHNSLEQFLINYANEKLQQVFILRTLQQEQDEYTSEGIVWKHIEFFNNKIVCDTIESKLHGIIAYLDENCIIPKGDDKSFLRAIETSLQGAEHIYRPHQHSDLFCIRHYAGDVEYSTSGFVEKNKDLAWKDLLKLGSSSSLTVAQAMFPAEEANERSVSRRPVTVATQFRAQINDLSKRLNTCSPHYIRCIKSNDNKQAKNYHDELAIHQIRYLGLVENVRVRRAGYAYRQTYDRFLQRYKMLAPTTWPLWEGEAKHGAQAILAPQGLHEKEHFDYGRTKLFIREPSTLFLLEERRNARIIELVISIQKAYRRRLGMLGRKAMLIQRAYRRHLAIRRYKELRRKAMGLFGVQKHRRAETFARPFRGDYLSLYGDARVDQLLATQECTTVLFVDKAEKFNRRFQAESCVLMLTDKAVYNIIPDKFKVRRRVRLQDISGISLSPYADNFVIIHVKGEHDFVLNVERKTEFVTSLNDAVIKITEKGIQVHFSSSISYTIKNGTTQDLEFVEQDAKSTACVEYKRGSRWAKKRRRIVISCGSADIVRNVRAVIEGN